jgi:hypothetical protein
MTITAVGTSDSVFAITFVLSAIYGYVKLALWVIKKLTN